MSIYQGDYAGLYDVFYGDKPYDAEAAFVDHTLRQLADGPSVRLLDVACGTGQHAVRLAGHGWQVLGVDQSEDMLTRARERAGNAPVTFVRQDMRAMDLAEAPFDAAVCLFDSIGYALTNEAITATLTGITARVRQRGVVLLEFWHAPPMLAHHEPVRVREWDTSEGRIVRISRTTLDVPRQVARVDYTVLRLGADDRYETWHEAHDNRFFLVQEMACLLATARLEPLRWFAGYDADAPIDASTWHVLVLARVQAAP